MMCLLVSCKLNAATRITFVICGNWKKLLLLLLLSPEMESVVYFFMSLVFASEIAM